MLLLSFSSLSFGAVETVTLSTGEWKPYVSHTLFGGGEVAKKVTESFAAVGISTKFEWLPWKRGYIVAKTGKVSGSFPWLKTEKTEQDFFFSKPILVSKTAFYHLKSKPLVWNGYADLKGKTIGGSLGYSYAKELKSEAKANSFTYQVAKSDIINLKKILKGRIDAFPCAVDVCNTLLKQLGGEALEKITYNNTKLFSEANYYLIISKKSKNSREIIKKFNEGLDLLK